MAALSLQHDNQSFRTLVIYIASTLPLLEAGKVQPSSVLLQKSGVSVRLVSNSAVLRSLNLLPDDVVTLA